MKRDRVMQLLFCVCWGFCTSVSLALADIKVEKYSPCEKIYRDMASHIKKAGSTHYAVATTGGRGLAEPNTSCGFDDGFGTKALLEASALKQCNIYKKKNGNSGACKVIESK